MGKLWSRARSREDQEPVLTEQPWRRTRGWSKKFRDDLKADIAGRFPNPSDGQPNVPCYNIALTGEIGAGKSSYFNSLNSIFRIEGGTGARADVGRGATSLTKEYRVYRITHNGQHLSWRICDTMGLQKNKQNDSLNILKAINGHVPDKFKFTDKEINQDTPGYIAHPELKDKAHCVAIVVNAQGLERMNEAVKEKLKTLRRELGAPRTYILLTHIDEACVEVNRDVTKVYHSIAIRNLVTKVGTMLDGLPNNHIFPIKNYKDQVELEDAMDILLLYPLSQMLSNAQSYLDDEMHQQPREASPASLTQRGHPVMQPADHD